MAKRKREELEVEQENVWTGFGFLRQLVVSTRKNIHKVSVLYAGETAEGTLTQASRKLNQVLAQMETSTLWIIRPKYVKDEQGKWKTIIPHRSREAKRWFAIDAHTGLQAFVGNLLAGPKDEGYLDLPKSLVVKLRSGNFTAKVRNTIFTRLNGARVNTKTMKGIQHAVGYYLVSLMVKYAKNPEKMASVAFINVCRWTIIDHIVRDLRDEGDKASIGRIRRSMKDPIDTFDYAGVSLGLKAGMKFISNDPELRVRFDTAKGKVIDRMEAFLIDILYKTMPEVQRVFALEGRHRVALAVDRKIMGQSTHRSMTKPVESKQLIAVPKFDTRRKRAWLEQREMLNNHLYEAMRRASVMPEDLRNGVCGFRIGGATTGQRSAPPSIVDNNGVTMFLTPMLALADAARRGDHSTILWAGKFPRQGVSLHSGTVTGIPKQGWTHLDIANSVHAQAHQISRFLLQPALDSSTASDLIEESSMTRLSRISAMFAGASQHPQAKPTLRTIVEKELARDDLTDEMRTYLSVLYEGCDSNPIHSAFWPTSMLVKYASTLEPGSVAKGLQIGTVLREALQNGKSRKQRRWEMYAQLDGSFSASVFSFAVVEVAKLNTKGHHEQQGRI